MKNQIKLLLNKFEESSKRQKVRYFAVFFFIGIIATAFYGEGTIVMIAFFIGCLYVGYKPKNIKDEKTAASNK